MSACIGYQNPLYKRQHTKDVINYLQSIGYKNVITKHPDFNNKSTNIYRSNPDQGMCFITCCSDARLIYNDSHPMWLDDYVFEKMYQENELIEFYNKAKELLIL